MDDLNDVHQIGKTYILRLRVSENRKLPKSKISAEMNKSTESQISVDTVKRCTVGLNGRITF